MSNDRKLNSLDTKLEQFRLSNSRHQDDVQNIIKGYSALIEEHSRLLDENKVLKDESIKEAVHVAAFPSRTVPRPYVLVLVDGNNYIFNDELIREKEEGGMRAARMLNEAAEKYLQRRTPRLDDARIIVRVYADLTSLSIRLAKANLSGKEKRSFSPFAAGFTRSLGFCDFLDALHEEGTKFKIRESFNAAFEDPACSHILYAACHDLSYMDNIVPHKVCRDKISLVQGADFDSNYHHFGLEVTDFSTIFRWSDLPTPAANPKHAPHTSERSKIATKNSGTKNGHASTSRNWRDINSYASDDVGVSLNGSQDVSSPHHKFKSQPCRYYAKGTCTRGDKCSYRHGSETTSTGSTEGFALDSVEDRPNRLPNILTPGLITINKHNHRLDKYLRPPTSQDWEIYRSYFKEKKPCNNYYLKGQCPNPYECEYDHEHLSPMLQYVLEYVVKENPCPRNGACREADCTYGHLCQKAGCPGPRLGKGCRMRKAMHGVDFQSMGTVPAIGKEEVRMREEDDGHGGFDLLV
ncbi:unnamed protein product [Periconia digitata]|uniref:C3H1-type domain-containing protein n=1 Tax=Periconia digitata TaxID=1303443 RepID=A0A9W4U7C1_9PLEO|nr:unnamed protein product [Periconia digitata]